MPEKRNVQRPHQASLPLGFGGSAQQTARSTREKAHQSIYDAVVQLKQPNTGRSLSEHTDACKAVSNTLDGKLRIVRKRQNHRQIDFEKRFRGSTRLRILPAKSPGEILNSLNIGSDGRAGDWRRVYDDFLAAYYKEIRKNVLAESSNEEHQDSK